MVGREAKDTFGATETTPVTLNPGQFIDDEAERYLEEHLDDDNVKVDKSAGSNVEGVCIGNNLIHPITTPFLESLQIDKVFFGYYYDIISYFMGNVITEREKRSSNPTFLLKKKSPPAPTQRKLILDFS